MNSKAAPFSCTHSSNLPDILQKLNCSLALSTYQAGKVVILSALNTERLILLPRTFTKPMGIAADRSRLAVATSAEVVVFNNASRMSANYPAQPNTYDALYLPRAIYFTGEVDIHDLHWTGDTLTAVNTRFSCLARIDHRYSFTPLWKPYFISRVTPEDRCHLNGVALENDQPRFATALGITDTPEGWRKNRGTGGVILDIPSNTPVAEGLAMPHSPRIYDGQLYVLASATGCLLCVDPTSGKTDTVTSLDGFVRGMDKLGDYVFIGLSQIRKKPGTFQDLPVSNKSVFCGVVVVHLPSANVVAWLRFEDTVEEIYDVRIMHGMRRPGLVNFEKKAYRMALTTPDEDYWAIMKNDAHEDKGGDTSTD